MDILNHAKELLPPVQGTGTRISGTVRDEIILEAPGSQAEETAARLEMIMKQVGHTYLTGVPIEVEVVICYDWTKK